MNERSGPERDQTCPGESGLGLVVEIVGVQDGLRGTVGYGSYLETLQFQTVTLAGVGYEHSLVHHHYLSTLLYLPFFLLLLLSCLFCQWQHIQRVHSQSGYEGHYTITRRTAHKQFCQGL